MAPKVPLGSDPRNPAAVKPWKRPVMKDDDLPPDFYALGALVLGLVGTMAKV